MHIETVVEHCCTALRKISFNQAMQTKVAQAGAIPLVLEAMERYLESQGVSEQGAACLGRLAQLHEVNQKIISDLGGLPVLTASCIKHPSCRELTYQTVQVIILSLAVCLPFTVPHSGCLLLTVPHSSCNCARVHG